MDLDANEELLLDNELVEYVEYGDWIDWVEYNDWNASIDCVLNVDVSAKMENDESEADIEFNDWLEIVDDVE